MGKIIPVSFILAPYGVSKLLLLLMVLKNRTKHRTAIFIHSAIIYATFSSFKNLPSGHIY
jgi:hypothetical protein